MTGYLRVLRVLVFVALPFSISFAQEKSVKPGVNDLFRDPDPKEFQGKFEIESREVFARRKEIVAACQLKPGLTVADIGAGTGLFTLDAQVRRVNTGDSVFIKIGGVHRIANDGPESLIIIETQLGLCLEDDIVRLEDDYGRS